MRATQFFIDTLRDAPSDAELISHQLMLRAGLIKKLGAGLYTWMPLGLRVLRKVEQIIREEMQTAGVLELLMPAVQPAELWHETGRWDTFGGQLLTMEDAHHRLYCFGPTHEEVVTDIMRQCLRSYKQLPLNVYQIQTKFRDEIRPRFGVMRAREFLMKDAYSFHLTEDCLQETYQKMYTAYERIIQRLGLKFRAVEADTGAIGGTASHEFQILADAGEDLIFYSDTGSYAANIEQATAQVPTAAVYDARQPPKTIVDTPALKTVESVALHLNIAPKHIAKTLIVEGMDHPLVAIVLCGDDTLNEIKAARHPLIKSPLVFADETTVSHTIGAPFGSLGPIGLDIPVIIDHYAHALSDFACGANQADKHYIHVAWERDITVEYLWDLRNVKDGDRAPDGIGTLQSCRGIEVGHVFALGKKYTEAMHAEVLNQEGKRASLFMGCYGFGVSRVIGAAIEQHHDAKGICWPSSMAPFDAVIIPLQAKNNPAIVSYAETLYEKLQALGMEVLLDDRNERAGVLFADHDLIGIPHRFVVNEALMAENLVEYKSRNSDTANTCAIASIQEVLPQISNPRLFDKK